VPHQAQPVRHQLSCSHSLPRPPFIVSPDHPSPTVHCFTQSPIAYHSSFRPITRRPPFTVSPNHPSPTVYHLARRPAFLPRDRPPSTVSPTHRRPSSPPSRPPSAVYLPALLRPCRPPCSLACPTTPSSVDQQHLLASNIAVLARPMALLRLSKDAALALPTALFASKDSDAVLARTIAPFLCIQRRLLRASDDTVLVRSTASPPCVQFHVLNSIVFMHRTTSFLQSQQCC
jgi:hypothetical protein